MKKNLRTFNTAKTNLKSCNNQEFFLVRKISDFHEPTKLYAIENLCFRRFQITKSNLLIRTFLDRVQFLCFPKYLTKREYTVQQTLNNNEVVTVLCTRKTNIN